MRNRCGVCVSNSGGCNSRWPLMVVCYYEVVGRCDFDTYTLFRTPAVISQIRNHLKRARWSL